MGYEIVNGIKFNDTTKEVFINAASNNVYPRTFNWQKMYGFSELYADRGKKEVIKLLLRLYWEGSFQPGVPNNISKSAALFKVQNPLIGYSNIADCGITDEDICCCPLEDVPKYLNIEDRRVKDVVKRRLNGETVDPKELSPSRTTTPQVLEEGLYSCYEAFNKREKGTFSIQIRTGYLGDTRGKHSYYVAYRAEDAKVFTSYEETSLMCDRYGFELKGITNTGG